MQANVSQPMLIDQCLRGQRDTWLSGSRGTMSGDMASKRHLIGRRMQQVATPSVTGVTASAEQIPTWVMITVASSVGAGACILLAILIGVFLMQKRAAKLGQAGHKSSSGPSKQLLSHATSSGDTIERRLIPKKAVGWPFFMRPLEPFPATVQSTMLHYSLAEVRRATQDFAEDGLLGEGRYGAVYRGTLDDGRVVAVKTVRVLPAAGELTWQGSRAEKEFLSEAEVIERVHHRHLVPLTGYSSSRVERILISPFMEGGSLKEKLKDGIAPLDWNARFRIAVGAAKGVSYLHEDCVPGILHRNIKSSNILLDEALEPQVANFGFDRSKATFGRTSSVVVGTPGYLPVECVLFGQHNSFKADVFAFGVVLLEILTGLPPVTGERGSKQTLAHTAKEASEAGAPLAALLDPSLRGRYDAGEALRVWSTALHCVSDDPEQRPQMGDALLMLQGKQPALPPLSQVHRLGSFPRVSSRARNPREVRDPRVLEKVDLWPRMADSPLARKISSPSSVPPLLDNSFQRPEPIKAVDSKPSDSFGLGSQTNDAAGPGVCSLGAISRAGCPQTLSPGGHHRENYGAAAHGDDEVWKADEDSERADVAPSSRSVMTSDQSGSAGTVLLHSHRSAAWQRNGSDTWQEDEAPGAPEESPLESGVRSPSAGTAVNSACVQADKPSDEEGRDDGGDSHGGPSSMTSGGEEWTGIQDQSPDWGRRTLKRSMSNPLFTIGRGGSSPLMNPLFAENEQLHGVKCATPGAGRLSRSGPLEECPLLKVY